MDTPKVLFYITLLGATVYISGLIISKIKEEIKSEV